MGKYWAICISAGNVSILENDDLKALMLDVEQESALNSKNFKVEFFKGERLKVSRDNLARYTILDENNGVQEKIFITNSGDHCFHVDSP